MRLKSVLVPACGLGLWFATSCERSQRTGSSQGAGAESTTYATNGARIYYTAKSESASPILTASTLGGELRPAAKACVDCHGADGAGSAIPTDSGYVRTPGIAFARLSSPLTYTGGVSYDEATLALTLRTGVRVDGYLLSPLMPRWQMSNTDMHDLIAHLKALDLQAGSGSAR